MTENLDFHGRTVVISGAGAGMGRGHALAFGRLGAAVVVNDISAESAESVASEIRGAGGIAHADTHDISDSAQAAALVADAVAAFGGVDVVISNAGLLRDADIADITDDDWRRVLGVNVDGSFYLTRAAWPFLRASASPRVVFVTSASGMFGNVGHAHYSTSKAAVIGLMRAVSLEGEADGIRSNAVAPLAVSPQSLAAVTGASRRISAREIIGDAFAGFDPAFVTGAVLALSHESHTGTGELVSVGGGLVRRAAMAVHEGFTQTTPDAVDLAQRWEDAGAGRLWSPASLQDDMREIRRRIEAGG